ncbi:electron transfer flavoprotein subunit beta/FixA family protein [Ohessyouella blattaphilus]|uniref:electron transfer flavoprotein subunit beta/FixA family protein n=1 Tax=Ohessyouella blattaphilus TaxID=2949333 RepID=UPI0021CA6CC3|nr:hypothetical protein [Ohessyouella blattaphilus]
MVDTSFVKSMLNVFDESALEMMLKLSDLGESLGTSIKLNGVTVGNKLCDNYLKTLYALGFARADRIESDDEILFKPERTVAALKEYIEKTEMPDLIVMGSKSADNASGCVPLFLAEELKIPCITAVTEMQLLEDGKVRVTNLYDGGIQIRDVQGTFMAVIGDVPGTYLRVPTLKERMQRGKKEIIPVLLETENEEKQKLINSHPVIEKREGRLVSSEDLYPFLKERMMKL